MAKLPNPNEGKPFDRVSKGLNGEDEYGFRRTDDGVEEVVHIPSGKSNMQYWQRESVLDPSKCKGHEFRVVDMGKREIECENCPFQTSFHPRDHREKDGKAWVRINKKEYPLGVV